MFIEKILAGLAWGLFIVAAAIPVVSFSVAWSWLDPMLRKPKEEECEEPEEPPELPENEESEPETPNYRFTASTIVRPPNVIRQESDDED